MRVSDLEDDEDELEEIEDEDYEDEPQSLKDKIQWQLDQLLAKVKSLGKKKEEAAADEEEESDEEKTQADIKKPDQKKRLIQGIIVVALIYFVAEEFFKEEEPPQAPTQLKARPDQVEAPDTPTDTPEETSLADEAAPATEDSVDQTDQGLSEASIANESESAPNEDAPSESAPPESVSQAPVDDSTFQVADEPFVTEDSAATMGDEPIVTEDTTPATDEAAPSDEPSMDQVGQGQLPNDVYGDLSSPIEDSEGDLTEKILQDLENQTKADATEKPTEYVAPPDYEYQGRGLVYNCKAQHWACVDGPSYKTCEQNASYLKENSKTPECYPFNIYETGKGCTNMQNRMVSSGASTDFCKGF